MIPPIYGIELLKRDTRVVEKLKLLGHGEVVEKFCSIENCHHRILERIYDEIVCYNIKNSYRPSGLDELIYKVWQCFNYEMLGKDYEEIEKHETRYNDLIKEIFEKLEADSCPQFRIYEDYWHEGNSDIFKSNSYSFAGNKFDLYYSNPEEDPNIEYKEIASFHMVIDGVICNDKVYGGRGPAFCILWLDYYKEKDQNGIEWYYRKVTLFDKIDKVFEIKHKINLLNPYLRNRNESKMENHNSLLAAYLNANFRQFKNDLSSLLKDASENTKLIAEIKIDDKLPENGDLVDHQFFLYFCTKNEKDESKFSKMP